MDEQRLEEKRQMARDEASARLENMEAAASELPYLVLADELYRRGFLTMPINP